MIPLTPDVVQQYAYAEPHGSHSVVRV
jgi:hypothetical protein